MKSMEASKTPDYAVLNSCGKYTSFTFKNHSIRFRTSAALKKYTEVKKWDSGYLVVTADYKKLGLTEEYIDLIPILKDLHFNEKEFLAPIKEVKIEY